MHTFRRRSQQASTLLLSVFIIALLATMLGVAFDYTANTGIASSRSQDLTGEQALAEGSLEAVFVAWKNYMVANQSLPIANYTTATNFTTLTAPLLTNLNAVATSSNYVVTALSIVAVDRSDNTLAAGQVAPTFSSDPTPVLTSVGTGSATPTAVPGWIGTGYTYRASATVSKWLNKGTNTPDASRTYTLSRYFQQTDSSLFQAMLFFQNDLELHPGPSMTLYGLVHTNANLYTAAGTGGSLTFNSNVSYHGSPSTFAPASTHPSNYHYDNTGYAEGVTQVLFNQETSNWIAFNNPVYTTSRNSQLSNVASLDPLGISTDLAIDPNNANASGDHEIIERPVPNSKTDPNASTSVPDPSTYVNHRLYNSAGLRIFINRGNATHPVTVWTPTTANVENSSQLPFSTGTQPATLADKIAAAITPDTSTGDIYDFREGRAINADTVDMSALTPLLNTYSGYNGVVYIQDVTNMDANGETGNSDAIRIKKGGVLPDNGLTLVTDGAVYVQGDYNTGTTYGPDLPGGAVVLAAQPVSNTAADPTQYTVSGYTAKPAAIVGDAVMMLSNSWLDSNSSLAIATRNAVPTTFNAALVSGQVLTTTGAASGGAHNFPRFLEDWSGDNFTYHGSMAQLYASKHFTGTYGKANVYSAPNRRWYFDTSYLTSPPPGNLRSTTYTRGRWVRDSTG